MSCVEWGHELPSNFSCFVFITFELRSSLGQNLGKIHLAESNWFFFFLVSISVIRIRSHHKLLFLQWVLFHFSSAKCKGSLNEIFLTCLYSIDNKDIWNYLMHFPSLSPIGVIVLESEISLGLIFKKILWYLLAIYHLSCLSKQKFQFSLGLQSVFLQEARMIMPDTMLFIDVGEVFLFQRILVFFIYNW